MPLFHTNALTAVTMYYDNRYDKKYSVIVLVVLTVIIFYGRGVPSFTTAASGSNVSLANMNPIYITEAEIRRGFS